MILNIIFIFFIYNKFFIFSIVLNNINNLNEYLNENLNEMILLEKQKFIGNNKKIINLFNRNHSVTVTDLDSTLVPGIKDTNSSTTKDANSTYGPTVIKGPLGTRFESQSSNPTTKGNVDTNTSGEDTSSVTGIGGVPDTVMEMKIKKGLERKKNILMKFGNSLNKYDTTTTNPYTNPTYSPNYNTATGVGTTDTNGYGYGYDQTVQPSQQPMVQPMNNNTMGQPVNQQMVQPPQQPMDTNPMNNNPMGQPMGQPMEQPMNNNPMMQPMNPMSNGTDNNNPMMQPYQHVPESYPDPNYMTQPNMNYGYGNEKDIHDSWKCVFFSFFFPECSKPSNSTQNQTINTPIPQQYCNTYSNKLPNLNDFKMNDNKWLLIKENNLICLTRSQPVDTFQFIEFKDNFCNKLFFSCQILLNENSIGGLMTRCNGNQKTLIELNSLTKTISLKLLNTQHIITLLEIPYKGLNVNFNHLLEVIDDGFQGKLKVLIDNELIFIKEKLFTQLIGSMGMYISSGNVTFGNITINPL